MEDNEKIVFDRSDSIEKPTTFSVEEFRQDHYVCVVPFLMLESFYFANFNKIRGILKGDLGLPSFFPYFKFQLGIIKGSFFLSTKKRETEVNEANSIMIPEIEFSRHMAICK